MQPLPFVPKVDAGALQQALINLLDNAIKFSRAGKGEANQRGEGDIVQICLAPSDDANTWTLSVKDHGPGIPKCEHQRIFERFYRLGEELRRETTGTGIGLAIVKHIVEGHGGNVRIVSELGRGSEFLMTFPVNNNR